jgi:hypothetical protein
LDYNVILPLTWVLIQFQAVLVPRKIGCSFTVKAQHYLQLAAYARKIIENRSMKLPYEIDLHCLGVNIPLHGAYTIGLSHFA